MNSSSGPLHTDRHPAENLTDDGTPPLAVQGSGHDHARQVRGTLVVVVEPLPGKYRRRASLTLASAQRAVERAALSGYPASIVLARLEPVGEVA